MFAELQSELLFDESDQALFDLRVSRNGRTAACNGIGLDIVSLAVSLKMATAPNKGTNEVPAFHTSTPSSRVCAPACAGSASASVSSIIR